MSLAFPNRFLGHFIQLADLQPDAHALTWAAGLAAWPTRSPTISKPTARYEGFDILGELIEWAQQSISTDSRFTFRKANIFNKWYNPKSALKAVDYRFPYDDASFDLFLTSVFTHMQGTEVRHYLDEICRAFRPGG